MTDEEIRRQVMEFDKSRVYTALNADELKVGSRVIVANCIADLKKRVVGYYKENVTGFVTVLASIKDEDNQFRFIINADIGEYAPVSWGLAYLVSEPGAVKFEDIKIGDVVSDGFTDFMVLGVDRVNNAIFLPRLEWISDTDLTRYHKKEADNDK